MDPNANLEEQLQLAASLARDYELGGMMPNIDPEEVNRLAELVLALNEWLVSGGFLPSSWDKP